MTGCDLQGLGILVTRPAHQAEALCEMIRAHGGRPQAFPALEILPPEEPETARAVLREARGIVIFISPNAVRYGLSLLPGGALPGGLKLAAVGAATAKSLGEAGHPVELLPAERFDSEGLLALPELQQLAGQQIVIVRGEGGRPLLGETLRVRGAEVVYAEVYRRACPADDPAPLLERWSETVDLVTATSNAIVANLIRMLGERGWPQLQRTPLLVISQRMQEQALKLGFDTVLMAETASDQAIVQRLCDWVTQGK